MKNLNETVYNKILIQAEEAKELGFNKLATGVLGAMAPMPRETIESYGALELKEDIYKKLWKAAMDVIAYHDLESVDIQTVDEAVSDLTTKVLSAVEASLNVTDQIGKLEPQLPGQSKK